MNPFRQQIRDFQRQHPLFQRPHPFWRDCFRGTLSVDDVRLWALNVYPVIRDFARWYVHVAAKCPTEQTLTFLAETIFEETGSGVEAESHPILFRRFLRELGVAESEIPDASCTESGRAHWEFCWNTVRNGSFLEGLTLVGIGIERPLPDFFQMIARAFERHYGIEPEALKFFKIHTVADVKHSQIASRIVAELARTLAEQTRVREVLFHLWDLQKLQLDGLHRAAASGIRSEPTAGDGSRIRTLPDPLFT
jgi:pyrroloquinoline quinone (PQQ) biosynthesis protein C